jgi:hypothetical protein
MLARLTASAPDFYIFREFRYLQSRVLLQLQDELRTLEAQLWRMDEIDRVKRPYDLRQRETCDQRDVYPRKQLLDRIQEKLVQYGQSLITKYHQWCILIRYQVNYSACPVNLLLWIGHPRSRR